MSVWVLPQRRAAVCTCSPGMSGRAHSYFSAILRCGLGMQRAIDLMIFLKTPLALIHRNAL